MVKFIHKSRFGANSHVTHRDVDQAERLQNETPRSAGRRCVTLLSSIVSDSPKQQVVGAVVSANGFTTAGQSEVLIAISARNDQMICLRRDVGRGSAVCGVASLEAPIVYAAPLRVIA